MRQLVILLLLLLPMKAFGTELMLCQHADGAFIAPVPKEPPEVAAAP